jgi:hypothetical protein
MTGMRFRHLLELNQSYREHFQNAIRYAFLSQKASMYFFVHGVYPDCFERDGSDIINKLNNEFKQRKTNGGDMQK